jgi:hypothetical protein
MLRSLLAAALALAPIQAVPQTPVATCSAPVPVPPTAIAPNSTYYSDGMPPERFRANNQVMVRFGSQADIEGICGKAPCGKIMLACQPPRQMILPNPCRYGPSDQYAKLVCHELAHLNGWPATHGD